MTKRKNEFLFFRRELGERQTDKLTFGHVTQEMEKDISSTINNTNSGVLNCRRKTCR